MSHVCDYDHLCGDGTSGSGCDKGTASMDVKTCCLGKNDVECGEGTFTCTKQGSAHYGWTYTSRCEDASGGVANLFGSFSQILKKVMEWVFIFVAGMLGLVLVYVFVKFLLNKVALGKQSE